MTPCLICGSQPTVMPGGSGYVVLCVDCADLGAPSATGSTREEAIRRWNAELREREWAEL